MSNFSNSSNYYRFEYAKGKKFICPQCNRKNKYVRFIDNKTEDYLPIEYGICERINNCGYKLNPYSDGYAKQIRDIENGITKITKITSKKKIFFIAPQKPIEQKQIYFDFETFRKTLDHYQDNVFIQNLLSNVKFPFMPEDVSEIIKLYRIGTHVSNGYFNGATSFPFIDVSGNVRAIQVKEFDEQNHSKGKPNFLHSIITTDYTRSKKKLPQWLEDYNSQEKKITCLFGEHLLKGNRQPIALVEAPKTAIYCKLYFRDHSVFKNCIWLATGAKGYFDYDKIKVLQGRFIYVFPDLSNDGITFNEWKTKAEDFEKQMTGTKFIFSDLLERLAPQEDRQKGNDLADVLIKLDWRNFRKQQPRKYEDYTKQERLIFGLKTFPTNDLQELALQMFDSKTEMSDKEIETYLSTSEQLSKNDVEDLMDILCIKQIIKVKSYSKYILNN